MFLFKFFDFGIFHFTRHRTKLCSTGNQRRWCSAGAFASI
jgi:hypothetical protein